MKNIQLQKWLLTAEKTESFSAACSFADFLVNYIKPEHLDILYIHEDLTSFEGNTRTRVDATELQFTKDNIQVEHTYQHGNFARGTSNFANAHLSQLIICGAERVSGFRRFWNGSETYKLIRLAKSSSFTIQEEYKKSTLDRIVVPIDSSPESTEKVLMAIEFAQIFNAEIHILGLDSGKSSENKQMLQSNILKATDLLNKNSVSFISQSFTGSNITDITLQYCDDCKADLVMMMAVEEANPKGMFEGSFPEQMILKSHIPVFALRPRHEI